MSHNGFWADKMVLITGLKGAWAWAWLERMGAQLSGLALAPETSPNRAEILGLTRRPSKAEFAPKMSGMAKSNNHGSPTNNPTRAAAERGL
jgi:hypothetical protein